MKSDMKNGKKNSNSASREPDVFEQLDYTRVQKHVYDAIKKNPEIDMRVLARTAKIPYSTVRHSINRLIQTGYLGPKRFAVLKELA